MNTKWMAFTAMVALALAAPMASAQAPGGGTGGARGGTGGPAGSHLPAGKRGDTSAADAPVSLQGQVQIQLEDLQDALKSNSRIRRTRCGSPRRSKAPLERTRTGC